MTAFEATHKRMLNISERMPDFPLQTMRLMRMTTHIQKISKDLTNAVLRKHDLVEASYMVLAVLYGTDNETSTASVLGQACHEKPANLTRVCNDLEQRGLIHRGARPGDRRSVMISLTETGRAVIASALPDVWQQVTHALDGFVPAELELLEQFYMRQLNNLNNAA
jgi:MarR family transcriptional repressor of emrRAB